MNQFEDPENGGDGHRADFLRALLTSLRCSEGLGTRPGITIRSDPARSESQTTAGYRIGEHLVVSCQPEIESMLQASCTDIEPTLAAWQARAEKLGATRIGGARMATLDDGALPDWSPRSGISIVRLDPTTKQDLARICALIESSTPDDLDEAELDLNDLDSLIYAAIDTTGRIASYASARPSAMAPNFGDIAVLTADDYRGLGLGAAAVAQLCVAMSNESLVPLYRCDDDNLASIGLSLKLGFSPATRLVAYRFDAN